MEKSIVLLSSGLDSTVNLFEARDKTNVILALTFDYGQKASEKEISQSKKITESLNIEHKIVSLPFFKNFTQTSLINEQAPVPQSLNIHNSEETLKSAKSVWVPNRNGIFLNIAAAYAEGLGAQLIIPGFNLEEAQTFPDNSDLYLQALNRAFTYSTSTGVQVKCYTTHMNKRQIAIRGKELGADFSLMWPCYLSNDEPCKVCESCLRFINATKGIL